MSQVNFTSPENVTTVLRNEYGFETTNITKMDSYFNVNYMVWCHLECDKTLEMKVVVKIFDQNAASFFDNSKLQHAFMLHLSNHGYKCSKPYQTKSRDTYVQHQSDKSDFLLQVLSFLPGDSINSLEFGNEDFLRMCYLSGENLAKLHLIGQTLDFKFQTRSSEFLYLPENALTGTEKISSVGDTKIIGQIKKHMSSYENNFLRVVNDLRKGFIHCDFSDCNVIATNVAGEWEFGGILDFEHCHFGYLVGGLGISIAYFLTKAVAIGCDIMHAAGALIRGYQSRNPLTGTEKNVLLDAIMSRLCVSYVIGCHQASLHPENSEFIFIQSKHIPRVFDMIDKTGRQHASELLF